jgi:choice-of-anchor C domain-containing protein
MIRSTSRLVGFAVSVGWSVFALSARAELIVNGGFELPDAGVTFVGRNSGDNFGGNGWTVDLGEVDHVGGFWQAAVGAQSLDLNGSNAGAVYQDLATTPGQKYLIRFALAGNPFGEDDKRLEILWDDAQIADIVFDQNTQTSTDMGWLYKEVTAVAVDSSTRLTFHSLTGAMNGNQGFQTYYGPAIDDVSVTAVPEPTGLALAIAGFAGAVISLHRCRSLIQGRPYASNG